MKAYFGYIEFGSLQVSGDVYPIALIHDLKYEFEIESEEQALAIYNSASDDYRSKYDYVIPALYDGEVYFTQEAKK